MMRSLAAAILLLALLSIPALPQAQANGKAKGLKSGNASTPTNAASNRVNENRNALDLLSMAEGDAGGLDGEMRGWTLWQIGMVYQTVDRSKALGVLKSALVVVKLSKEEPSDPIANNESLKKEILALHKLIGNPSLPPKLLLERDIARSIVLLDPKLTDQVSQEVDPAVRSAVLTSALGNQVTEKHFDSAFELLNQISAQGEMPYQQAVLLMDTLKPEQSAQLTQLFVAALTSYRDHAPHSQLQDNFSVMLTRFWKRMPDKVVRQAIDEILEQAADSKTEGNFGVRSDKGSSTVHSLYEYRLFQIMPVIQEADPSAAKEYQQKYPSLPSVNGNSELPGATWSSSNGQTGRSRWFHATDLASVMASNSPEYTAAQRVAAESDNGHLEDAISDAANLRAPNLRSRIYEYIGTAAAANKQSSVAHHAIEGMLQAAEKLEPANGFPYYATAAQLYKEIDEIDAAKEAVEAGWKVAGRLYEKDADDDDPNTALAAFWPSTNAYCAMLRQAAAISDTWAISLLENLKDPEIRVAAEIALAGGLLKSPVGPRTTMFSTKKSGSFFTASQ